MSNDNPTAESEPLHAATLLAVLAKLRDRLTEIPALIAEDTADHPLTDCEVAEWGARVEALEAFAGTVALMLKDADPRARVVVLPEPFSKPGSVGVTDWPCGVWSDGKTVHITGSVASAQTGPVVAGSILAAVEHVTGGAE